MSAISGIDHIEINVHDLDRMVEFFKRVGFVEVRRTKHTGGSVELRFPGPEDGPILELNSSDKEPKGLGHIALRAVDIDAAFAEILAKPDLRILRPLGPPRPDSGRRIFNIQDPDGNKLQVSSKI